ncbi:geranylgeranylglycerol-phosphate geranylgeranyltransferase [Cognatitamlana onchidii]|uniref:geranylgeranylglycerol-phosphate geranylgeranyltransferase n=1 Tax=Cognatitamlana onchidii TaxID=2562860 RepID=UPI0010A613D9|nr:geranylgeranylglycerol-phosphate geranylgeranyltransferase [Algibacter onchidii]
MNFLNLIRWKNLLMIALVQLLIKYALLEPFGAQTSLNSAGIFLLIIATTCIAAAGNIINDINDIQTDLINKPDKIIVGHSISLKTAYNLYIVFTSFGVIIGFLLTKLINQSSFFILFVVISALLYVYATQLKRTFLIGNIVISFLVGSSILIVGVFELLPNITALNRATQIVFFKTIFDYGVFAFALTLLREIAKDIEDIDGDYNANMNTLPIVIGRARAKHVLSVLNFFPLGAIILYTILNLYKQPIAVLYFLLLVIGPFIYISVKTFSAKSKKDFHAISNLYKLVMLFGMLSLLLYKYVILN